MVEPTAERTILDLMPHQAPFRFIDRILSLEERRIESRYRFREEEYFYGGHYPGNPITPGVILIEAMAQTGLVALGIAMMLEQNMSAERITQMTLLFSLADRVQFDGVVYPGQTIRVQARNLFFRRATIKSEVNVFHENGGPVCSGLLTGSAIGGAHQQTGLRRPIDRRDYRRKE